MSTTTSCIERLSQGLSQTGTALLKVKRVDRTHWAKQLDEFGIGVEREVKLAGESLLLIATTTDSVDNVFKA